MTSSFMRSSVLQLRSCRILSENEIDFFIGRDWGCGSEVTRLRARSGTGPMRVGGIRGRGLKPAARAPFWPEAVAAKRWSVAVAAMLGLASLSACASTRPRSELYDMVGHGKLTLGALRVIIRDCARRFPAVLEQAATALGEGPTTAKQRKGLTEFKANGVPMVQSVLLQQDPVAALLDGWALLYQLRDFLEHAAGDQARVHEAVRTVEGLAGELARLWAELTGRQDVGPARARIEAWAHEHPLRGSLLARDSTAPLLASVLGRGELSVMGAAGTALESVQDAIARLDLYAINLPRQARWQAEAAVQDLSNAPGVERAIASLDHAIALAEPLSELAAETSAIVSRERTAVLAGIDRERAALQRFLRDERRALLADIASERAAALQQADGVARGLVDRVFDRLQRVLLLVAVATVGFVLAMALLGWLLLSRRRRGGILAPAADPRGGARLTEREA
jgi:hypothetical protein